MHLTEAELMAGYGRTGEYASRDEDALLQAVTDALTFTGWTWVHIRRSDLAITQGSPGFPDVLAMRDGTLLAVELKSQTGRLTLDQVAWLRSFSLVARSPEAFAGHHMRARIHVLVIRPTDLDELLLGITGKDPDAFARLEDQAIYGEKPARQLPEAVDL